VSTAILVGLPAAAFPQSIKPFDVALLIPQALPLTMPLAVVLGIAFGMGGRRVSRRSVRILIVLAILCSIASFVTLGWVMPSANQAYRQSTFEALGNQGIVIKGAQEMTMRELRATIDRMGASGGHTGSYLEPWSYYLRWALSAASLTIVMFIFAVSRGGKVLPRAVIVAAPGFYWVLLYAGEALVARSILSPPAGAWLPNLFFGLAAITMAVRPRADTAYRQG
jgi:lipopolysaccharide export LptBFGC system permease protein LptF